MIGKARRTQRQRSASWFYLLTALLVFASLFVVAGAQVASAAQCSQAGAGAGCHLAFRLQNPAKSGSYTDTSPHQAGINQTITNTDLDPSGFLVTVEVEDGLGRRDTSYTGQISITPFTGLTDLTTDPTANGARSFTLKIANAGYFQLTATVPETGIAPVTSAVFRIQKSVCVSNGDPCTDSFQNEGVTLMEASLTNGGGGTIGLSVAIDGVDVLAGGSGLTSCSVPATSSTPGFTDPFFHAPAEWTVDEVRATSATTKLLVIRIEKAWRQIRPDNGASSYRPCISAFVSFTPWDSSPVTFNPASGEYTALAPDCGKGITYFCRAYVKSNKSGDVLEGISLPSGTVAGDPRGH
jgi:hypothetical protein